MKKLLLILLTTLSLFGITIQWDQNPVSDNVVSYRLYQQVGNTNGTWTVVTNIASTSTTIIQVPVVVFYYVTALNSQGLESPPSNIAAWTNRPNAPTNLRIVFP